MFDVGVKQEGNAPQVSFEYTDDEPGVSNEEYLQNLIAQSNGNMV